MIWHDARVRTSAWIAPALASSLALGCIDDVTFAESLGDEVSTDSGSDSGPGPGTDSGTTGESESSESESSESETGEPLPVCGDGVLDPDEECDDGNADESDGCTSACESACAAQGWFDLTIPEGWFAIQQIATRPSNELAALGAVEIDGQAGRLRVVRVAEDQLAAAIESAPLGSIGTPELPQTHRIDATASTPDGESILVLGTSTEVLVVDEAPVVSHWLARFDGASLTEQWRVAIPVSAGELGPIGLAVLDGGDAIVTRTIEVAANDRDLGVERYSVVDGAMVWTSSFSGPLEGGWSLDSAGPVAVGGDRVWATAIVRVDWQTFETNLVEFDPATGAVLWSDVPLADTGNTHEQRISSLAAGPGGTVALAIDVLGPSPASTYGVSFGYLERERIWTLAPEDLPWDGGDPYVSPMVGVDQDGKVLVVGRYTHDFGNLTAARPWVVAIGPEGAILCAARIGEGNNAALTRALGFFGGGRGVVNLDTYGPGGMGPGSAGNWIVALRG